MRIFLIVLGGVLLSGIVMALIVPVAPSVTWLAAPVLVACVVLIWQLASRGVPANASLKGEM